MATNANRDKATNGRAFQRSVADALVGEAEEYFSNRYELTPSDGIRGAAFTNVSEFITIRANEELTLIGHPIDDASAAAFRAAVGTAVMSHPAIRINSVIGRVYHILGAIERDSILSSTIKRHDSIK